MEKLLSFSVVHFSFSKIRLTVSPCPSEVILGKSYHRLKDSAAWRLELPAFLGRCKARGSSFHHRIEAHISFKRRSIRIAIVLTTANLLLPFAYNIFTVCRHLYWLPKIRSCITEVLSSELNQPLCMYSIMIFRCLYTQQEKQHFIWKNLIQHLDSFLQSLAK